jgi:hypothetical protein
VLHIQGAVNSGPEHVHEEAEKGVTLKHGGVGMWEKSTCQGGRGGRVPVLHFSTNWL